MGLPGVTRSQASYPLANAVNRPGWHWLPVQVAINLKTVDIDVLQLGKRDVAPFRVQQVIVQDGKAEEQVFAVELRYVLVAAPEEEMQVDDLFLQRYMLSGVKPGHLVQKLFRWWVPHIALQMKMKKPPARVCARGVGRHSVADFDCIISDY